MKIGIEVEFFGFKAGKPVLLSQFGIPTDANPILAEARGKPYSCPFEAIGSVRAEIDRITSLMRRNDVTPAFYDWLPKDRHYDKLFETALRNGMNKRIAWRNMHGLEPSKRNDTHQSAGLHISFTQEQEFHYAEGKSPSNFKYNKMWDAHHLFRAIELEFGKEIKTAKRTPGFYEVKPCGRIEYRSLPATVIHAKEFAARLSHAIAQANGANLQTSWEPSLDDEGEDGES
jgi:hypothetical protein